MMLSELACTSEKLILLLLPPQAWQAAEELAIQTAAMTALLLHTKIVTTLENVRGTWHLFCPSIDDERDQLVLTPLKTLKIRTNTVQVTTSTKCPEVEPLPVIKKKKKMPFPPVWRRLVTVDQTSLKQSHTRANQNKRCHHNPPMCPGNQGHAVAHHSCTVHQEEKCEHPVPDEKIVDVSRGPLPDF